MNDGPKACNKEYSMISHVFFLYFYKKLKIFNPHTLEGSMISLTDEKICLMIKESSRSDLFRSKNEFEIRVLAKVDRIRPKNG